MYICLPPPFFFFSFPGLTVSPSDVVNSEQFAETASSLTPNSRYQYFEDALALWGLGEKLEHARAKRLISMLSFSGQTDRANLCVAV